MQEKILIIPIVIAPVFLLNSCKKESVQDIQNSINDIIDTDMTDFENLFLDVLNGRE